MNVFNLIKKTNNLAIIAFVNDQQNKNEISLTLVRDSDKLTPTSIDYFQNLYDGKMSYDELFKHISDDLQKEFEEAKTHDDAIQCIARCICRVVTSLTIPAVDEKLDECY